ncbi:MAG TPA: hypothetical protein VEU11_05915 [Terriglobales bacterium]|nr:hypothetical protein [Terriglobales bacterium]
MKDADAVRRTTTWWPSDLGVMVLEVAIPVALLNFLGLLAGVWLPQWASLACSVWALLVLQFGPILVPKVREIEEE